MSVSHENRPQGLTKYPTASIREVLNLSLPLILSLFSGSLMGFCNRLFLAHCSLNSLEGGVNAAYLCTLFQHPCIRITSLVQVFVGLYTGSNRLSQIGTSIWQMIWFSLFSIFLTLPLGQWLGPLFFEGTTIKESAMSYFSILMYANFLFPLGAALSSFFIGRGKTRVIFLTTLLVHACNISLDRILILGVPGFVEPMGVTGAAIANTFSQALFCVVLLILFLRKKEDQVYGTRAYALNWPSFWGQIRLGLPRAIARLTILTAWVYTARIMSLKGGDFLLVLSIGNSLILLFTFINDGLGQGLITIASHLIGSQNYAAIWKMVRSAAFILVTASLLMALPYILYPESTLFFFSKDPLVIESMGMLKRSCIWLWVFFLCYGYNIIGLSLVTAARDVTFYMVINVFVWVTSFLPAYFAFNYWNWTPDTLWLIMAFDAFIFGTIFLIRASKERLMNSGLKVSKPLEA